MDYTIIKCNYSPIIVLIVVCFVLGNSWVTYGEVNMVYLNAFHEWLFKFFAGVALLVMCCVLYCICRAVITVLVCSLFVCILSMKQLVDYVSCKTYEEYDSNV